MKSRNGLEQRTLPRTVSTDQRNDASFIDMQGDVLDSMDFPIKKYRYS